MTIDTGAVAPVGVRERKRQALRRKLSDTATAMFLEHGFDEVRVSDVAEACGVSTKTVWNHFATKESLLLDRSDRLAEALSGDLEGTDVLEVVLGTIETEIEQLHVADASAGARESDPIASVQAFVRLVEAHPGLRDAAAGRFELLVRQAAEAVAAQTGTPVRSPHNEILAGALVSLWRLHLGALLQAAEEGLGPEDVQAHVRRQVQVGAELVALLAETATTSSDPEAGDGRR